MWRGFTLIELMITVAIVAILAAVALPSYLGQLRKSARAEAQSYMTEAATWQQQYLVDRRSYANSLATPGAPQPAGDLSGKFTFAVVATDGPPPTFTITGTAQGTQALDACPSLQIDQAGNRTPPACW